MQASEREITGVELRETMSHLPTGVTILTAYGADEQYGMAANSVTSLSLDPPLILVCPAKSSSTWPKIRETGKFCVNVMAKDSMELILQFASRGAEKFRNAEHWPGPSGPVLEQAVASINCVLIDEYEGGDHTIAIARVVETQTKKTDDPVIFLRGKYGSFCGHE